MYVHPIYVLKKILYIKHLPKEFHDINENLKSGKQFL